MKLSTGKVAFPIEFDTGDKEVIYFNPSDPDLSQRLINSKDNISNRIKGLNFEGLEIDNNGEIPEVENLEDFAKLSEKEQNDLLEKSKEKAKIFNETKNIIFEELNYAFGSNVSKAVFKHCSPFAIVNGEYFVMQFLREITPEIQKEIAKSNKETEKKMSRHLGKYVK